MSRIPNELSDLSPVQVPSALPIPWRSYFVTAGVVLAVFILLQVWRPYFFLTDDNMSSVVPAFADLGDTLRHGRIPRTTEGLYGGTYEMWHDPGSLTLLFPTHIAGILLATTRFRLAAIDAIALVDLLVGAIAMQACIRAFGRRFDRTLPDWVAGFLGVSYVTSVYSLAIGSSWFNFLGNQAALPIVALGLATPRRKTGLALITAGMLYSLIGGHLSPFLFSALFLGIFSVGLSAVEKKWESLWRYAGGSLLAIVVVSPALIGPVSSFLGSSRNLTNTTAAVVENNLPFPALFLGATVGLESIGSWNFQPILGSLAEVALPLSFSAAAICFLAVLGTMTKFRPLDWIVFAMLLLVALFLHRPDWLQKILSGVPFFRSLRWPMREAMLFLFFAHLLVGLGWSRLPRLLRSALPPISAAAFAIPLFLMPSPTLNRFPVDRALLLDGRATKVWQEVRALLPEASNCYVVPLLDRNLYLALGRRRFTSKAPHTLMGGYNYPVLFGMKSSTGYTMPGFAQKFHGHVPALWIGYFSPARFSKEEMADPHLLFTAIQSVEPVVIEYQLGSKRVQASFPNGLEQQPVVKAVP
jgi:hypothetical protein